VLEARAVDCGVVLVGEGGVLLFRLRCNGRLARVADAVQTVDVWCSLSTGHANNPREGAVYYEYATTLFVVYVGRNRLDIRCIYCDSKGYSPGDKLEDALRFIQAR
jgi:hypothetical protein